MNVRRRYIPIAVGWTALVAALLLGVPLLLRDRLPDPLATHWGLSGAPDGASSFWSNSLSVLALWLVPAGIALQQMIWGDALRRRRTRGWACATLTGAAVFALGIQTLVILANLDRADWRDAAPVALPAVLGGLLLSALAMWGGWALARPGPDDAGPPPRVPEWTRRLRPGERAVWVSSASASRLVILGSGSLVLAALLGTLVQADATVRILLVAINVASAIAILTFSSVRVQVDSRGLEMAFGPLRRPMRRIPLDRIHGAHVETRRPSDVGGWLHRIRPGGTTIMIRGGECLVVRHDSGELAVSVDDAERGAALLNTLLDEPVHDRS